MDIGPLAVKMGCSVDQLRTALGKFGRVEVIGTQIFVRATTWARAKRTWLAVLETLEAGSSEDGD